MSYPYSQINRLAEPHNYMYTTFQGKALLQSYQSSRMEFVNRLINTEYARLEPDKMLVTYALPVIEKRFDATTFEGDKTFRSLLKSKIFERSKINEDILKGLANELNGLTTEGPVTTLSLLHALIAVQLTNDRGDNTKVWLDRLVHRFEVTKKIYESYLTGFRKGEGANTSARLYWLFALALCLFYVKSNEIIYLSTLLKVCDLLCSLPESELSGHVPEFGLSAVLAAEIVSVQLLAQSKGVSFAPE